VAQPIEHRQVPGHHEPLDRARERLADRGQRLERRQPASAQDVTDRLCQPAQHRRRSTVRGHAVGIRTLLPEEMRHLVEAARHLEVLPGSDRVGLDLHEGRSRTCTPSKISSAGSRVPIPSWLPLTASPALAGRLAIGWLACPRR